MPSVDIFPNFVIRWAQFLENLSRVWTQHFHNGVQELAYGTHWKHDYQGFPKANVCPFRKLCILVMGMASIDQSHRYRRPRADCRETSGKLWQDVLELLYVFEHKTQYLLIRAPYTRIVVCGNISTPNDFAKSNLSLYPHVFYSSNICEILLYNRQLVVITHALIYGVRAAYRSGKIIVRPVYWNPAIIII